MTHQDHKNGISDEELGTKLSVGEAEYLGSQKKLDGQTYDYYRLEDNGEVTFIYNVRSKEEG